MALIALAAASHPPLVVNKPFHPYGNVLAFITWLARVSCLDVVFCEPWHFGQDFVLTFKPAAGLVQTKACIDQSLEFFFKFRDTLLG